MQSTCSRRAVNSRQQATQFAEPLGSTEEMADDLSPSTCRDYVDAPREIRGVAIKVRRSNLHSQARRVISRAPAFFDLGCQVSIFAGYRVFQAAILKRP